MAASSSYPSPPPSDPDPHLQIARALDDVTSHLQQQVGERLPTIVINYVEAEAAAAAIRKSVANRAAHRLATMKASELAELTTRLQPRYVEH